MTPPQTPWQKAALQEVPPDIIKAANQVAVWFEEQGSTEWELFSVASRRLVDRLHKENAELKDLVDKMKGILRRFVAALDFNHTNAVRATVGDLGVELEYHMRDALSTHPTPESK